MTHKERLYAALRGESVDRLPYAPFLAYWWEHQPEAMQKRGQLQVMLDMGADPLLRGFGKAWKVEFKGTEFTREIRGNWRTEKVITPIGTLEKGYRYSPDGNTWFLVNHPIREAEQFKVLQWMYEHAEVTSDGEADRLVSETRENGLVLPIVGCEYKTCFQSLVEHWVGTEALCYLLADEPDVIDECLSAMNVVSQKTAEFSAESSAEGFIFWEDSSTTNINPAMFEKYTMPEIEGWGRTLHAAGKLLIHHACGHIKALLPLMARLPVDMVESISPPPTGDIEMDDALALLPEHIGLIGGIEPVFFENCTMETLDARVRQLMDMAKGRRYILANSDSCPPSVDFEKFLAVSRIITGGKACSSIRNI